MSLSVTALVSSRLTVDFGRMTYLRNYGQPIWLPCPAYLISGGESPILVDTSGTAEVMSKLRLEPVEDIIPLEDALAQAGYKPSDVKTVIITHLMYDHCANAGMFPNAKFVVQQKELDFAADPHPAYAGVYQDFLYRDLNFQAIDGDYDLAPGVKLLHTPGHSPGGQSVAVETDRGTEIITGFCCIGANFEPTTSEAWVSDKQPEVVAPGIHLSMTEVYDSASRVKSLADVIIPFHDPAYAGLKTIPEELP